MEKTKEYHGVYHVLNGVISTTKGILPEDINIESLINRVNEQTEEVIIATNPTVEGETTALYLSKILESKNINVTRIAHGLPMGGHLDYADELTLIKAIEGRKKYNRETKNFTIFFINYGNMIKYIYTTKQVIEWLQ